MVIKFPRKFSSKQLEDIIPKIIESSFTTEKIQFDLSSVEWIARQEATLLIGWLSLIMNNTLTNVKVILPSQTTLAGDDAYAQLEYTNRKSKLRQEEFREEFLKAVWNRRKQILYYFLYKWNIRFQLNEFEKQKRIEFEFSNIPDKYIESYKNEKNDVHLIPFYKHKIDSFGERIDLDSLNTTLKEGINTQFETTNIKQVLSQEEAELGNIEQEIKKSFANVIKNFDNKALSHIINTELVYNSVHHAFPSTLPKDRLIDKEFNEDFLTKDNKEFYFSAGLSRQFSKDQKALNYILKKNVEDEKPSEEQKFYQTIIQDEENTTVGYRNETFLEFTFLDFGIGIPNSLRSSYRTFLEKNKETIKLKEELSFSHQSKITEDNYKINEDSRILEYAFLLDSSSKPFKEYLEISSFIPRGLYFVVDMVKQYKGMLTVRSGFGKIVFDFSKPSPQVIFAKENPKNYFPGTLLSLSIPTLYTPKLTAPKRYKINTASEATPTVNKFISLTSLYFAARENHNNRPDKKESEINQELTIEELYYNSFNLLNITLDSLSKDEKTILIVDFAGTNANDVLPHKILYYLTNSPKIHANVSVVVCNVCNQNALDIVQRTIINNHIFLLRPIPCFTLKNEIVWVGVKTKDLANQLTIAWKEENGNKMLSGISFEGSTISLQIGSFNEAVNLIATELPKQEIENTFLKNKNVYREGEEGGKFVYYLTSSGYYQTKFINWSEDLYFRQKRNQLAHYLLTNYISKGLITEARPNVSNPMFEYPTIDYVIAVTLSAQLLAKAVCDFYTDNNIQESPPKLIRLADYYEYKNEPAFKTIMQDGDKKVLLINDVIATGKLIGRIINDIKSGCEIKGVFSLVDCRGGTTDGIVLDAKLADDIEDKIICLSYNNEIARISEPSDPIRTTIIPINPILNAPASLSIEKSETEKIIFKDPKDFLELIDYKYLLLGHFDRGPLHHNYYIRAQELFKEEKEGKSFIRSIIEAKNNLEDENANPDIARIIHAIELLKERDKKPEKNNSIYNDSINKIKQLKDHVVLKERAYDYLFYPIYSSAEGIKDYEFKSILGKDNLVVFALPRIDTPKGWRFTFPPRFLNKETKGKNILILDDGSATGETLIQMIDSICFLEVKSIDVISIAVRMEDFQREFFSRIKWVTAKRDKQEVGKIETNKPAELFESNTPDVYIDSEQNIIPIRIFFGNHLHLPFFNSKSNCIYCEEILKLNQYLKDVETPQSVKNYIDKRLMELELRDPEKTAKGNTIPSYMPFFSKDYSKENPKLTKEFLVRRLYLLRDRIGKIDTYRLFSDYPFKLEEFEDYDIEIFFAILLHEPPVVNVLKHIGKSIFKKVKTKLEQIVFEGESAIFDWSKTSLLRLLSIADIDENEYYLNSDKSHKIIEYAYGDLEALDYITFRYFSFCFDEDTRNIIKSCLKVNEIVNFQYDVTEKSLHLKALFRDTLTQLQQKEKECQADKKSQIKKAFLELSHFYNLEDTNRIKHKQLEKPLNDMITFIRGMNPYNHKSLISYINDTWNNDIDSLSEVIKNKIISNIKMLNAFIVDSHFLTDITKEIRTLNQSITIYIDSLNTENIGNIETELMPNIIKLNKIIAVNTTASESKFISFFVNYPMRLDVLLSSCYEQYSNCLNLASDKSKYPCLPPNINSKISCEDIFLDIHKDSFVLILKEHFKNFSHAIEESGIDFSKDQFEILVEIDSPFLLMKFIQPNRFNLPTSDTGTGLKKIEKIIRHYDGEFILPSKDAVNPSFTLKIPIYVK